VTNAIYHHRHSECKRTTRCPICGNAITTKRAGRKRRFCSHRCRDEAWRNRNFQKTAHTKQSRRNAINSPTQSIICDGQKRGRASVDAALWRQILDIEVIGGRDWLPVVSSDGVASQMALLAPPLLRGSP
jgi:endogenous inhibitor of DNA gyrase (YacG/DUF329 family)